MTDEEALARLEEGMAATFEKPFTSPREGLVPVWTEPWDGSRGYTTWCHPPKNIAVSVTIHAGGEGIYIEEKTNDG